MLSSCQRTADSKKISSQEHIQESSHPPTLSLIFKFFSKTNFGSIVCKIYSVKNLYKYVRKKFHQKVNDHQNIELRCRILIGKLLIQKGSLLWNTFRNPVILQLSEQFSCFLIKTHSLVLSVNIQIIMNLYKYGGKKIHKNVNARQHISRIKKYLSL